MKIFELPNLFVCSGSKYPLYPSPNFYIKLEFKKKGIVSFALPISVHPTHFDGVSGVLYFELSGRVEKTFIYTCFKINSIF